MPIFARKLHEDASHCDLLEFWSDPPTTTAQRLKGLTTGSLPTFIDISKNFASDNITEDNWIDQLVAHDRRITIMGDDTWGSLFPGRFSKQFFYPSFNVRDLHTVDNGVLEHLDEELALSDWDVLIAHFLGVDHAGHTFGRDTPQMATKLAQMNQVVEDLIPKIDSDTLLLIMGDHGMTLEGNHGGASDDELSAALFVYGKQLNVQISEKKRESTPQIDLVPSLSLVLGLPIPFGNLGKLIPSFFTEATFEEALQENVNQVRTFIEFYSANFRAFQPDDLLELSSLNGIPYLSKASDMCRQVWATFDLFFMTIGAIGQLLCLYLMFQSIKLSSTAFLLGLAVGPLISVGIFEIILKQTSSWNAFAAGLLLGPLVVHLKPPRGLLRADPLVAILVIFDGFGRFSNSFIEAEKEANFFLLTTLIMCIGVQSIRGSSGSKSVQTALSFALTSFLAHFAEISPILNLGFALLILVSISEKKTWPLLGLVFGYFYVKLFHLDLFESLDLLRLGFPRIVILWCFLSLVLFRKRDALEMLVVLMSGPRHALASAMFVFQFRFLSKIPKSFRGLFGVLLARAFFYNSHHLSSFSTVDFESGFVGIDSASNLISGVLIVFSTLCAFSLFPALSDIGIIASVQCFLTTLFVFGARRHLMVWRVFAPKFIFDAAIAIATWVFLAINNWLH